jgi:chromosome segregation ATPase
VQFAVQLKEKEQLLAELKAETKNSGGYNSADNEILKRKLNNQQNELDKINDLYQRLKNQLREVSGMLERREKELREKNSLLDELKNEAAANHNKLIAVEESYSRLKQRQREADARLSEAADLNRALQGRVDEASDFLSPGSVTSVKSSGMKTFEALPVLSHNDDQQLKQRAEELKKKVEVILSVPDQNNKKK